MTENKDALKMHSFRQRSKPFTYTNVAIAARWADDEGKQVLVLQLRRNDAAKSLTNLLLASATRVKA